MTRRPPTVLVVSDQTPPYTDWLRERCAVRLAYTGPQARASLTGDVDTIVFDGPVLDFDVEELAAAGRRHGCRTITVTDATPGAVPDGVATVPGAVSTPHLRDALAAALPTRSERRATPPKRETTVHGTATGATRAELAVTAVREFLE